MGLGLYLKRMIRYVIKGMPEYHITVDVKETMPNHQLEGKNIIVTGAGSGLGYYIAKRCIAEGAKVLITGRNENKLKKAASELGIVDGRCLIPQMYKEWGSFLNKQKNNLREKKYMH